MSGEFLSGSLRPGPGAAAIRSHADEADDEVIQLDPESTLHRIVVGRVTGSAHRAQALGKGCQHDTVSSAAGGEELLSSMARTAWAEGAGSPSFSAE
jgi:hypothetical protein